MLQATHHLSGGSTEKLAAMVNDTASKLDTIWNEVGFSSAEREVQIQVLLQEVQRLFEEKVTDEEAVRDTFLQSIEENKAKASGAATRLGETEPNLETDDDGSKVWHQRTACSREEFVILTLGRRPCCVAPPRSLALADCSSGIDRATCPL